MTEKTTNHAGRVGPPRGERSLKYAFIAFAIIEALVLVPLVLHRMFR